MARAGPEDDGAGDRVPPRRRIWRLLASALAVFVILALAAVWFGRERIADNIIGSALASRGVHATYQIEEIGPRRQVLTHIVVGDPAKPDLTIERAEVLIRPRFGFPAIAEISLSRPLIRGSYHDGKLSFGALDPLIFTGSEEPFALPDFRLKIEGGRGGLATDYGPIGIGLAGSGHLQDGFSGNLAIIARELAAGGCDLGGTALRGKVGIDAGRPTFKGPLHIARLDCNESSLHLSDTDILLTARGDRTLDGVEGETRVSTGRMRYHDNRAAGAGGLAEFTWRKQGLTARYDLTASEIATPHASLARLGTEGTLRLRRGFARIELTGEIEGAGLDTGAVLDRSLAAAGDSSRDTLLGPLVQRLHTAIRSQTQGSTLAADYIVRRDAGATTFVVPHAIVRGGGGAPLLSLSRFQLGGGEGAMPRFSGNLATGGDGLPRIAARMESGSDGQILLRLTMADYRAGDSRLAIPHLEVTQEADGTLAFTGRISADGALPGGSADNLLLPISGRWGPERGLTMWDACTDVRFASLRYANLTLEGRTLRLCPPRGRSVLRYGPAGFDIAAGTPSLDLSGRLGETPIRIASGAVGFALPGNLSARRLMVTLGPPEGAARLAVDDLSARIGRDVTGKFAGADVTLYGVPLDIRQAAGDWSYDDGRLSLSQGSFRLEDGAAQDRFEPLIARGANLALENNLIVADALLREPRSDRPIVRADVKHSLESGAGHADLAFEDVRFDAALQPAELSYLALGVVANVEGSVTGRGEIDWNETGITSSGRFSSRSLDFAAPFGPVKGASGTIVFTDLLGLTTAPGQLVHIASVNPGIEATNGRIALQLTNGTELSLRGGTWPFLGGTLRLRPVTLNLGENEVRRYVLDMEGLDAGLFAQRMELENISVSGTFDGTVPLVFDANGGWVDQGLLVSRPPGGNFSYVGELTYEDLSPMANFAFDALRSLDYRQMTVQMDGALAGDIVTRVRFDGVSQGAGARRNFITRQIARLPFRFDVNIRAPFYGLIGTIKAMYDPAFIRDPRELGLIDAQGRPIRERTQGEPVDGSPVPPVIQSPESENAP